MLGLCRSSLHRSYGPVHVCRRTNVDGGGEAAVVPIFVAAQGHALPSRATQ